MKNRNTKSVKLLVITLTIFVLLMIALCYLAIDLAKEHVYSERSNYLQELTNRNSELLSEQMNFELRMIQALSNSLVLHQEIDKDHIFDTLSEAYATNYFDELGVILPDQRVYTVRQGITTLPEAYPYNFIPKSPYISDQFLHNIYGDSILLSYPLAHNGYSLGVAFGIIATDRLADNLNLANFSTAANIYVIKKDGTPILRSNSNGSYGEFDNFYSAILKQEKDLQASKALEQNIGKDLNGNLIVNHSKHLVYTKVKTNDWYIITIVPTTALTSNLMINRLTYSVMMIVAISIIFSYIIIASTIKHNKQLEIIAYTDDVTGFSNFNSFKHSCSKLIKSNHHLNYAVVSFDINQFKVVNDIYGHDIGNTVLRHIAKVLSTLITEKECFGRIAADNFSLLLSYNQDNEIIYRLQAISSQVSGFIDGYIISLSFGICRVVDPKTEVSLLCDRASIAKSTIKSTIGLNYAFYNKNRRNELVREKEIENLMEGALINKEFICYLQPQFRLENDEIFGAEALVRWNKPGRGLISPAEFIPVFEKNGFIKKLDYYMFEQVCILLSKWRRTNPGFFPLIISVNLSRLHLSTPTLCQDLLAITNKYMVDPSSIEIELTESAVYEDAARMIEVMKNLKSLGFILAIDDFGSGYSSLNTLKDIPADVLKLDKGFLDQSVSNKRVTHIITSLIDMAKSMGIMTIAEGVENSHHVRFLRQAGCDIAQGYFYSKPLPPEVFEEQLASLSLGKTNLPQAANILPTTNTFS